MTETIRTQPVPIWGQVMDQGDYPHDYFTNFAAMACDVSALVFPAMITTPLIGFFATIVLPEKKNWITEEYLPVILRATKNNNIPFALR